MNGPAAYSVRFGLAGAEGSRQASQTPARRLILLLARSILLALLYYVLVAASMKVHLSSTQALIWPSNALLVATLLLSSKRHWWIYLLAVIPAHVAGLSPYHAGLWWMAYQVAANSVLAIACAVALERFKPQVLHFEMLREVLIFLALAVIMPSLVALTAIYPVVKLASSATLLAHGWTRDFGAVWGSRWITNSASIMVFVPAILICVTQGRSWLRGFSLRQAGEASLLMAALITVTFQIYGHVYVAQDAQPAVYLIPIPLLLWAAVRFGPAGASLSITVLVCVSSWCAYLGEGPFLRSISIDRVTVLQLFWMVVAAPVLALAAVVQESKASASASVESEERFRYLFSQAPVGIALEDMDGKLLFANPALCSMLGYTQEELTGMNCSQFADAEDEQEDWEQFQAMRAGLQQRYQIEKRYVRKDGRKIWGRLNVSMLNRAGVPAMVLATVEDITEKRAALEELQRAHAELQQLTPRLFSAQEQERRRISRDLHDDFGQRLSLLMGELGSLERELPTEANGHSRIRKLLEELDEMVADLHNMSHQLHSWKLELLGLSAALKDICRQLEHQYHITINLSAGQLPELRKEVSLCFYRVAQEALTNAVKHSKSPQIDVNVAADGCVLRMRVRDFGVGFDPAIQRNGLGLISMQERLRMIGGVVRFNSVLGGGTELEAEANLNREQPALKDDHDSSLDATRQDKAS